MSSPKPEKNPQLEKFGSLLGIDRSDPTEFTNEISSKTHDDQVTSSKQFKKPEEETTVEKQKMQKIEFFEDSVDAKSSFENLSQLIENNSEKISRKAIDSTFFSNLSETPFQKIERLKSEIFNLEKEINRISSELSKDFGEIVEDDNFKVFGPRATVKKDVERYKEILLNLEKILNENLRVSKTSENLKSFSSFFYEKTFLSPKIEKIVGKIENEHSVEKKELEIVENLHQNFEKSLENEKDLERMKINHSMERTLFLELEDRISKLERVVGLEKDNFFQICEPDISTVLNSIEKEVSLLVKGGVFPIPQILDLPLPAQIPVSPQNASASPQLPMSPTQSPHTQQTQTKNLEDFATVQKTFEKIGNLSEFSEEIPLIIGRLKTLKKVHDEAVNSQEQLSQICKNQKNLEENLKKFWKFFGFSSEEKSQENSIFNKKMEEKFETVKNSMEKLDSRIDGLVEKMDKILSMKNRSQNSEEKSSK